MRKTKIIEHGALGPAERRAAPRLPANDRLVRIEHEGDRAVGQCRDISDVGAKLASSMHFGLNDIVEVVFPSLDRSDTTLWDANLSGRVVWTKGEECGIAFDHRIDCSALLTAADKTPTARPLPAVIDHDESPEHPQAHDAASGEDGAAQPRFQPGLRVKVLLESGEERAALVRWTSDNYAGLYLLDRARIGELPPEPFALIED